MHDQDGFENFRRERNKRRMESGPLRPMGQNAAVLRELEEVEAREVRNQQLTREVHEFFAEATRTAASIVTQVAEHAETEVQEAVTHEMTEFLAETMRRVQEFVELVQVSTPDGVAQRDVAVNMQNIVGHVLDSFRFAGDAVTAEAHVGQDPFRTPLDGEAAPSEGPQSSMAHDLADPETADEAASQLAFWFDRVRANDETLRKTLKVLVQHDVMSKDEARAIYRGAARLAR
jgi:hypothetical protein